MTKPHAHNLMSNHPLLKQRSTLTVAPFCPLIALVCLGIGYIAIASDRSASAVSDGETARDDLGRLR